MPSIKEIKPGYWRVRVSLGKGPDGKYDRWSEYVRGDRPAAQRRAYEMEVEKRTRATAPPAPGMTLAAWYAQVIARAEQDHSPSTIRGYRKHWQRIDAALGNAPIDRITRAAVQAFVDDLRQSKNIRDTWRAEKETIKAEDVREIGANTVVKIFRTLHWLLADAVRRGLLPANPAEHVQLPRVRKTAAGGLTVEEVRALAKHLPTEPLMTRVILQTLLYTGIRRGELVALRWRDVEQVGDGADAITIIRVERAVVVVNGQQTPRVPKTPGSLRPIGAPADLYTLLMEWRAQFKTAPAPDDYILRWPDTGAWMCYDHVTRIVPEVLTRAGVRRLRCHDMRHTYASLLIASGLDIRQAQSLLGHSTPTTTLNTYAHLITNPLKRAAAAIPTLLAPEIGPTSPKKPKNKRKTSGSPEPS